MLNCSTLFSLTGSFLALDVNEEKVQFLRSYSFYIFKYKFKDIKLVSKGKNKTLNLSVII